MANGWAWPILVVIGTKRKASSSEREESRLSKVPLASKDRKEEVSTNSSKLDKGDELQPLASWINPKKKHAAKKRISSKKKSRSIVSKKATNLSAGAQYDRSDGFVDMDEEAGHPMPPPPQC